MPNIMPRKENSNDDRVGRRHHRPPSSATARRGPTDFDCRGIVPSSPSSSSSYSSSPSSFVYKSGNAIEHHHRSPVDEVAASFFVPSPIGGGGGAVATMIPHDDEYDECDVGREPGGGRRRVAVRTAPVKTPPLATVDEDASASSHSSSTRDDGGGGRRGRGWAGIGFGRPISVTGGSSPASSASSSPLFREGAPTSRPVDRGDDDDGGGGDDRPTVIEDDEADDDDDNMRRLGILARRALRDCRAKEGEEEEVGEEELSINPSRLFGTDDDDDDAGGGGSIASISSAMTRDGCIDLARRLGRIESGLLEAAGEYTRSDAFRALAKAATRQAKRADSLGRKAGRQERKIEILEALCEKLTTTTDRENAMLRSSMRAEMDALGRENARLVEKLRTSEADNAGLKARAAEMSERLRRMEEENVRVSRLLLDSYSKSANHDDDDGDPPRGRSGGETTDPRRSTFDEPPRDEYSRRRAEADRAEIERLRSEMRVHAKREGRSERKVALLMEIKSAMEEQIRFLEGGGEDEDDVSVR